MCWLQNIPLKRNFDLSWLLEHEGGGSGMLKIWRRIGVDDGFRRVKRGGGRHVIKSKIDHGQNCHTGHQEKRAKKFLVGTLEGEEYW